MRPLIEIENSGQLVILASLGKPSVDCPYHCMHCVAVDCSLPGEGRALFQGMQHAQVWESMVIAICRDPFTSTFDGERGEKCIGNEVAFDAAGSAESAEDFPMARARIDEGTVWLIAEFLGKGQRLLHATRRIEHAGVRHDAKKPA